ncbi:hypothetical protein KC331_g54 [Hortaea werneckii]|nr:hypothetical protein KC331_g54 [Hortaea werneckii]
MGFHYFSQLPPSSRSNNESRMGLLHFLLLDPCFVRRLLQSPVRQSIPTHCPQLSSQTNAYLPVHRSQSKAMHPICIDHIWLMNGFDVLRGRKAGIARNDNSRATRRDNDKCTAQMKTRSTYSAAFPWQSSSPTFESLPLIADTRNVCRDSAISVKFSAGYRTLMVTSRPAYLPA